MTLWSHLNPPEHFSPMVAVKVLLLTLKVYNCYADFYFCIHNAKLPKKVSIFSVWNFQKFCNHSLKYLLGEILADCWSLFLGFCFSACFLRTDPRWEFFWPWIQNVHGSASDCPFSWCRAKTQTAEWGIVIRLNRQPWKLWVKLMAWKQARTTRNAPNTEKLGAYV